MESITVLVDMDGIVADLATEWYNRWNAQHPEREPLTVDKVTDWDVGIAAGDKRIYKVLSEPHLYQAIQPFPNAIESIKYLHKFRKDGQRVFDIVFVTAAIKDPGILTDKALWMQRHFPFIDTKNIFYGYRKYMVKGDVLIDDSPKNIELYQRAWPQAKVVTIDHPYNRNVTPDFRAFGYSDVAHAWEQIKQYLAQLLASRENTHANIRCD